LACCPFVFAIRLKGTPFAAAAVGGSHQPADRALATSWGLTG